MDHRSTTTNRRRCDHARAARPLRLRPLMLLAATLLGAGPAAAQDFPNVARVPGELLAGPVAPEQGRTAIVAWHGGRIVSVPEAPGSQPGADLQIRVVNLEALDTTGPSVTVVPAHTSGFHAHGYYQTGPYLFVGPHCLGDALDPCNGTYPHDIWGNAFRIGGAGTPIGDSELRRGDIDSETGLLLGSVQRAGAQSPWGLNDFWTYNTIGGDMWLAVRRNNDWVYDWGNGGAPVGPAITAYWDHLGLTGVTGFPFIMGNILIVASDQAGSGVATYDISDLSNPVLLDVLKDSNPGGYWPEIYGHYLFFPRRDGEGGVGSLAGFMVVDFEDPANLQVVANRNLEGSNQYVTFQDEFAFMNRYKIDMRTFDVALELETVPGVIDASQFALPVGNLVVTGGYGTDGPGLAIWAHQAEADTRGPFVAYHVPVPDQTNYPVELPITLSIPESLRTETIVDGVSLVLRPVGGAPVATWHSFSQGKLLTVTPQQALDSDTTYELELTPGILDAAGNALEHYSFRFSTGNAVTGGNAAPSIASVTVDPDEPVPGANVNFQWSGSDPEGDPVEYRIDFGDGSPRTEWSALTTALHAYAEAGHYQITVQARDDGGAISASTRKIAVVDPPADPGSTASGPIALDSSTQRVFVVGPDSDTVTAIDLDTDVAAWEAQVGGHPVSLARVADGSLWVACRDSDTLVVLAAASGTVLAEIPLDYGAAPVALAATPDAVLVSLEGKGSLARFDVASRTQTGSVTLGPFPRAIAVTADGSRALVTRFISGQHEGSVYDVNLAGDMSLGGTIRLARDHSTDGSASGRGVPNYLAGIRIDPDGARAWVVGKKDNTTRGTFFAPSMVPGQDSTVRAMLAAIDLATSQEDASLRLDIDNSDSPSAIGFSPRGDYAFLALQGNNQIAVIDVLDLLRQDSPGTVGSRWSTGLAPQGIAVDETTGTVVSMNFMGRSVTVFDAAAFLGTGSLNVPSTTTGTVAVELLAPDVLQGKRIFYDASDTRMSAEGYMSCATCHIDGSHDGRTWDFTNRGEGFRNTADLRGRAGTGHGNVHWTANFDEIQDFENDIRGFFGGSGFLGDADFAATSDPLGPMKSGLDGDLDALAAYVASLTGASLPRAPERNPDGTRSAAAESGAAHFAAEGCASCHVPSTDYTDRTMHDVGTLRASSGERLGGPLEGIETPTLLGTHASAPYFHDGSAATLEDVFTATGGRLVQAEEGNLGGGAYAQDIAWFPMKEWHQGAYVEISGGQTITFDDVTTTLAGDGYVEIRYAVQYGTANLRIAVNGGGALIVPLAMTPNSPSFVPTEWRTLRVPVTFASGANSIALARTSGGVLAIDDVLFSTPDDAALASAHVRELAAGDMADLVAFVASLDASDAIPAGECGGAGQPDCGSALVVSKANLTLGSASRPDKGQIKIGAELPEGLSAGELLADLAAGLAVRVTDADASFDVALTIAGCALRSDGHTVACGSMQEGARALLRPRGGGWRLTLKAHDLAATVTGADDAGANPVQGPANVVMVRGGVAHAGAASDCRERYPRKLSCRN
jgi:DNA-binding beta-propeller fold protein YncE